MLTPRPASICYEQEVDLPWPRGDADEHVFEIEKKLRQVFAERAGVRI
jgi:hypothetical protein